MRRKVKRTLRVRTTETWTITWRSDSGSERPSKRTRRRRLKAPPGETAKGDVEHDMTTTLLQPMETLHSEINPHSQTGEQP
jgi:hypothetical protein